MRLPPMKVLMRKTDGVTRFAGYDHRLKIRDNAFYDMRNMCHGKLPVMSVRPARGLLRTLVRPNGLFAHDSLCWVDGTGFYYDGCKVGEVTDTPKQMVRMGAYVLIWPDEKYYNTHTGEFGSLEAQTETKGTVKCHLCRADGQIYTDYTVSETEPETHENGTLWLDVSQTPHVLRCYSDMSGMWASVPTVYTRIEAEGIGAGFETFDGVTISGMENEALNGSFYLTDCGENYLIVIALIREMHTQTAPVTVTREIPKMDYVCELDNRIWGCSSEKHEIYASALGDAKNWHRYLGQSTDSYAVTVGSGGDFTGCCAHLGSVLFFKENAIHRVMGYKPQNFQLDTTECRGVMKGCEKSLCTVNETLMYKSPFGVCRFGTALPQGVSDALGEETYAHAVGGALGARYFVSMQDREGAPALFVYDTESGLWMREDDADVMAFAALDGEMYMLLRSGQLLSVNGGGIERYGDESAALEEKVPWMLETGDIGLDEPFSRYLSGIQLHAVCDIGTAVRMEVCYDAETRWQEVYREAPITRRSLTIPYATGRCRTLRLRLRGTGGFRLYSITKTTEAGSDVYGA